MPIWIPTCYKDKNLKIKDSLEEDYIFSAKRIRALLRDINVPVTLYDDEKMALEIYLDSHQRTIVESLFVCKDIELPEMAKLLELDESSLEMYKKIFFDVDKYLGRRIKLVGYIENGLEKAESEDNESMRSFYMFKKWALNLGKEFISWKFSLTSTDMSTESLYNTVITEAFFYHKEKSIGMKDIPASEYQRSVNSLLSGLKTRQSISESADGDDPSRDFINNLGIIIKEKENTDFALGGDFVNNVEVVSKEEHEEIFDEKEQDE